jgi:RNA polymerase sigma-70 factor, ECF subfamily
MDRLMSRTGAVGVTQGDDSDERLLAEVGRRSRSAMDELYRRHAPRVYRFAFARIGDPLAADDVVNEVMLKVWLEASRFRARSRVSTWILGIAHHQSMDYLRARYRHPAEPLDERMADPDEVDMPAVLAAAESAANVRRAMERLSEEHRAVLHLAFFEDLGYDRIAEILGCPEGTVKSRVHHAKLLLKRYLANSR